MVTRDPDAKRAALLEAGLAEFAEFGEAGARVDRLAKRAGVSAGLVYTYFGSKEGLFNAVYDHIVEAVSDAAPIDADALGEYAAALHDAGQQNPDVLRLVNWHALERGDDGPARASVERSMGRKLAAIEDAQRRGVITSEMSSGQVLALTLTLANMWTCQGEGVQGLVSQGQRRATIVEAVKRIVAP